jgi:hypothetical protein
MSNVSDARDLGAFIPSYLDDFNLDMPCFRLYAHIARRAGSGLCWESIDKMADSCHMNRKTAYKAFQFLQDHRLILVEKRKGQTSLITLTNHSVWIPIPNQVQVKGYPKSGTRVSQKRDMGVPETVQPPIPNQVQPPIPNQVHKGIPIEVTPIEVTPIKEDPILFAEPNEVIEARQAQLVLEVESFPLAQSDPGFTDETFGAFWSQTVMKVNREKARLAFLRVGKNVKGISFELVLEAWTQQQRRHMEEKGTVQYLRRAEAWLNGHCWEDCEDPFVQAGIKPEDVRRELKKAQLVAMLQESNREKQESYA